MQQSEGLLRLLGLPQLEMEIRAEHKIQRPDLRIPLNIVPLELPEIETISGFRLYTLHEFFGIRQIIVACYGAGLLIA